MPDAIDRRSFLGRGVRTLAGVAAVGAAPGLLAGWEASANASPTRRAALARTPHLGSLSVVGPWVPDVETCGEYLALERGYWTEQGFSSVTIIPAGPDAPPQETTVETGKAFYGISSLDATSAAIEKGFKLVVLGAQYQKSPFCMMSPAHHPIRTPREMIGKKIGVGSDNDALWYEFLKVNHISKSQLTTVPVGFDPTPLTQGTVDGWLAFITNEPIELALKGFKTYTFLFANFGLPEIGNIYITKKSSVAHSRTKVKAALIGEILGWKAALTDPAAAAHLAVKKGQGLGYKAELLQAYAQNKLIAADDALKGGLFWASAKTRAASLRTVALGGTHVKESEVFDMSILEEIYKEHPSLKRVPKPVTR
ncbi:MAG: ABC transporter substrate-binding protein [Acidimicrobiales bacterium]